MSSLGWNSPFEPIVRPLKHSTFSRPSLTQAIMLHASMLATYFALHDGLRETGP
jgi:hypothetical protein